MPSPARARFLPLLIPAAMSVAFLVVWAAGSFASDSHDFGVFLRAGSDLAAGRSDIYSAAEGGPGAHVFLYPPAFAALFAPLSFLPLEAAYVVWVLLSIWLWFAGLSMLGRTLSVNNPPRWLGLLLLATCGPVLDDIRAGQVNLALTGVLAFMLASACASRPRGTGALLALAAHMKAIPGALLVPLAASGRRVAAVWFFAFSVAFALLPGVWLLPHHGLFGAIERTFALHVEYVSQLILPAVASQSAPVALSDSQFNMSLPHALGEWTGRIGLPAALGRGLGLLFGLAMFGEAVRIAWQRRDSAQDWVTASGLAFTAVLLMNPTTWLLHLPALALALGPLLIQIKRNGRVARMLAGGCIALGLLCYLPQLVALNPVSPAWVHGVLRYSVGTIGVVIFWVVVRLALRETNREVKAGACET